MTTGRCFGNPDDVFVDKSDEELAREHDEKQHPLAFKNALELEKTDGCYS
jgi:hypothetical protein